MKKTPKLFTLALCCTLALFNDIQGKLQLVWLQPSQDQASADSDAKSKCVPADYCHLTEFLTFSLLSPSYIRENWRKRK